MTTTDAVKNAGVDAMTDLMGWASLHDDTPGTTGANELTGGSYARKQVTWGSASGGVASLVGTLPTFDVPGGSTVAYVGLFSAEEGGTFRAFAQVTSETFSGDGTYEVESGSLTLTDA